MQMPGGCSMIFIGHSFGGLIIQRVSSMSQPLRNVSNYLGDCRSHLGYWIQLPSRSISRSYNSRYTASQEWLCHIRKIYSFYWQNPQFWQSWYYSERSYAGFKKLVRSTKQLYALVEQVNCLHQICVRVVSDQCTGLYWDCMFIYLLSWFGLTSSVLR